MTLWLKIYRYIKNRYFTVTQWILVTQKNNFEWNYYIWTMGTFSMPNLMEKVERLIKTSQKRRLFFHHVFSASTSFTIILENWIFKTWNRPSEYDLFSTIHKQYETGQKSYFPHFSLWLFDYGRNSRDSFLTKKIKSRILIIWPVL